MAMQPFKFDSSNLLKGLSAFESKAEIAVRMYAETSAPIMEADAKLNVLWTDRSSSARTRLSCTVIKTATGYRLKLSHGVNYGIWLELANEKKYAVIEKTIRFTGTFKIIPGLERLLERMK